MEHPVDADGISAREIPITFAGASRISTLSIKEEYFKKATYPCLTP